MMPNVSARPRELDTRPARAHEPARERESKKLDDVSSDEPVENTDEANESNNEDGTRSVQDLIAAALKMFANAEPKVEAAKIEAPAIQLAAAPSIEAAVQHVLDQIIAKPETNANAESSTDTPAEKGDVQLPEGMLLVEPELQTDAPMTSRGPVATTAVRDPAPLPENPNPSHVNLVLEDGAERVVVTVAVRGNEVHAMLRGGDEQTAAALARNAGSLDHALRAGGLDLASFTAERDLDHHAPREQQEREQQDAKFEEDLT
jgi:hypothetical protein